MNIKLLKQLRKNITIYYNNINKVYKVVDNIDSIIEYFGEEDLAKEFYRKLVLDKIKKDSKGKYKEIK